jgi:hypothetical protein
MHSFFSKMIIFAALFYVCTAPLNAAILEYELERMVGWTIVASKTVDGHFEGCNVGRKIIFTDGTYLTCMGLGLSLGLSPRAIIFGRSTMYQGQNINMYKVFINGEFYDAR